jgi:hypothetical protein
MMAAGHRYYSLSPILAIHSLSSYIKCRLAMRVQELAYMRQLLAMTEACALTIVLLVQITLSLVISLPMAFVTMVSIAGHK